MQRILLLVSILSLFAGCHYVRDPYPDLIETQKTLMSGCDLLGLVAETADANQIFSTIAQREMVTRVKARSVQLGATHIVWLHKTETGAAAEAYRCPVR